jgi:NADH-quinone oxidoreductase subunit L
MFHLITHAFFKSLLFLGAGSVIHGCHEEQDIRRLGGLRRRMPVTFATYAVGMMALSGVPLFFSGFWSKDEILQRAWLWEPSRWPFVLGLAGAWLTAFYMTRQVCEVFFGRHRGGRGDVHESPRSMTVPLVVLAVAAVGLGLVGTPAWPWFEAYLEGHSPDFDLARLLHALPMMGVSTVVVALGVGSGWWLYGRKSRSAVAAPDAIEAGWPRAFGALRNRLWVDELYEATVVRGHRAFGAAAAGLDRWVLGGLVRATAVGFGLCGWVARWVDELFVNLGFDTGCAGLGAGGRGFSKVQAGRAQRYLALLAVGTAVLVVTLIWGLRPS